MHLGLQALSLEGCLAEAELRPICALLEHPPKALLDQGTNGGSVAAGGGLGLLYNSISNIYSCLHMGTHIIFFGLS